jgi:hypothetical protein
MWCALYWLAVISVRFVSRIFCLIICRCLSDNNWNIDKATAVFSMMQVLACLTSTIFMSIRPDQFYCTRIHAQWCISLTNYFWFFLPLPHSVIITDHSSISTMLLALTFCVYWIYWYSIHIVWHVLSICGLPTMSDSFYFCHNMLSICGWTPTLSTCHSVGGRDLWQHWILVIAWGQWFMTINRPQSEGNILRTRAVYVSMDHAIVINSAKGTVVLCVSECVCFQAGFYIPGLCVENKVLIIAFSRCALWVLCFVKKCWRHLLTTTAFFACWWALNGQLSLHFKKV